MTGKEAAKLGECNGWIYPFEEDDIYKLENKKEQDRSFNEPPCTCGEIFHSDIAVFSAAKYCIVLR